MGGRSRPRRRRTERAPRTRTAAPRRSSTRRTLPPTSVACGRKSCRVVGCGSTRSSGPSSAKSGSREPCATGDSQSRSSAAQSLLGSRPPCGGLRAARWAADGGAGACSKRRQQQPASGRAERGTARPSRLRGRQHVGEAAPLGLALYHKLEGLRVGLQAQRDRLSVPDAQRIKVDALDLHRVAAAQVLLRTHRVWSEWRRRVGWGSSPAPACMCALQHKRGRAQQLAWRAETA